MKAFPLDYNIVNIEKWQGMDLKDYFAAKAMQSFLSSNCWNLTLKESAIKAYEVADMMMRIRNDSIN